MPGADMRAWVLMAHSSPGDMRCWVYRHGYCRFCSQEYSTTLGAEDDSITAAHLTNSPSQVAYSCNPC